MTDAELAADLATRAGTLLLELRAGGEFEGKTLGAEGDLRANVLLLAGLAEARPGDAVLSEESQDDRARLAARRVWIVDPLDGTREYGEGRSDWAVHVALTENGAPMAGAVALPGLGLTLRSDRPIAVPPPASPPRMVVSRTRPAREAIAVAEALGAELVPMGSAGAKAMAVVRGEAEIYLHSGGQYEWDSCAPVAVALGHGLHCSRLDGSPLLYNQAETYLPDLLICHRDQAEGLLALIGQVSAPPAS
jgi:3'(2'), 5'-bisphosphate nucleotidase